MTSAVVIAIAPPSALLVRSAINPVMVKFPEPEMVRVLPSAMAAALIVAVLPEV